MRLTVTGSKKEFFSAHLETWHKGTDGLLLPCPFCGSDDIGLSNTHTAYYWAVCNKCNCEMPGEGSGIGNFKTISECVIAHEEAINSAIKEWNNRTKKT